MLNLVFAITVTLALNGGLVSQSHAADAQKPSHIPLEAFAQLKSASQMKLSPDGTHLAYFMVYKGRQVILVKTLEGNVVGGIPAGDGAEISWFQWANDERLVISYTSRRYSSITRETRLFGADRNGKNITNLILPRKKSSIGTRLGKETIPAQVQDDVIDWLPDDPDHIMVALDSDLDGSDEVRKINVLSGKFKEITKGRQGIQSYQTDQQHKLRLAWGYDKSNFKNRYKIPGTKGWRDIEKAPWGEKGFDLLAFTPDPKIAYAKGYNAKGRKAVFRINLETDEILDPVFSHDVVDYDYLVSHPVTGNPIGVQYTVDQPKVAYFDKNLQRIQKIVDKALPDTVNKLVGLQEKKKLYLVRAMSDIESGVYYLLDMNKKELKFIAETMPGITSDDMARVQVVEYENRIGVPIPGYLTIPRGKSVKKLPTIVYVHGGPHARDTRMFDYMVQFLASRGYAVLQPNFQGSSGFGRAFENAGRHQWGGRMQDDVTDGTKWLIEQGIADPERICIIGASYGGYAAAMGLIKTPNLFRCAASINAVLNMPSLIRQDEKYIGGTVWTKTMGMEDKDSEEVSPYHRVDEIMKPLLIVHAKDDHRVRYSQAERMARKMKKRNKDVTLVTLEDGDHFQDTEVSRVETLIAVEKFLAKHLKGAK